MTRWIVVLSGQIRAGKTSLATKLSERCGMKVVKTHDLIKNAYSKISIDGRIPLQQYGEKLDRETKGQWVANELGRAALTERTDSAFVVDAARIPEQAEAIRRAFPLVTHVHLTAPDEELKRRYELRAKIDKDPTSYAQAKKNATERQVERLSKIADIVIDTGRCTEEDVFVRATNRMSIYKHDSGYVDVVVGGQYGSEGKGQIVSFLAREYDVIVRVGGPNAGHTVKDSMGKSFVYHHIPSGAMTNDNVKLILAPGMVVNVQGLRKEIAACGIDYHRLSIDPKVMTIAKGDPESEESLYLNIGSTKQGVGAATARRIMGRGLKSVVMARDVPELRHFIRPTHEVLFEALARNERILIEGTQGTGLSLYHGPYPYVTSRDTTVAGCLSETGISPKQIRRVVMVCRTYPIRAGDPAGKGTTGPFSIPIDWGIVGQRSGIPRKTLEETEVGSTTGRQRRVGEFDWELLRRSAFVNGPTDVALTFADYLTVRNRKAIRFEQLADETIEFIEEIERVAGASVSLISTGKGVRHVIDRRSW